MPPLVLLIVHPSIEDPLDFDLLIVHLLEVVINYGCCLAAVPHVLKKLELLPLELLLELASDLLLFFKLSSFDGRHVCLHHVHLFVRLLLNKVDLQVQLSVYEAVNGRIHDLVISTTGLGCRQCR